ncbi:hypothetical protein BJP36_41985 [Moorena producens JHB]|uniref:Uncharacterized protein n=1 Tax=Moorena producens (strain JHB) TaxID=1454205 RepID=A0A9Q9UVK4_MOOP1|nr:hypothetical protein [Moorena producens]WAN68931.1 hypothetical protein BJP36_41985 [Moorena producens JHB]
MIIFVSDSRFPIPDSRFPIPDSLKSRFFYLIAMIIAISLW